MPKVMPAAKGGDCDDNDDDDDDDDDGKESDRPVEEKDCEYANVCAE